VPADVEKAQLDTLGDPREDTEVGAPAIGCGTQRIGFAGLDQLLKLTVRGDACYLITSCSEL